MTVCIFGNMFYNKPVDATMFEAFKWIVIGGLGFTASEQFANKSGDKVNSQVNGTSETTNVAPSSGTTAQ